MDSRITVLFKSDIHGSEMFRNRDTKRVCTVHLALTADRRKDMSMKTSH